MSIDHLWPEPYAALFHVLARVREEHGLAISGSVNGVIWGFREGDPTLLVAACDHDDEWRFFPCDEEYWSELSDIPMPQPPEEWR